MSDNNPMLNSINIPLAFRSSPTSTETNSPIVLWSRLSGWKNIMKTILCPMAIHGFQLNSFVICKVPLTTQSSISRSNIRFFRWKTFSFFDLILIGPQPEKIIEVTHIWNMFLHRLGRRFRGTTPQDFNSFHIYERNNETIWNGDSDPASNWNSQVCRCCEWDSILA